MNSMIRSKTQKPQTLQPKAVNPWSLNPALYEGFGV